ncbi:MAG TPA: aminotransferase class V-fold PLP-dependent enzyme [Pirellulales bacterium]|nr:aminotransferase class V-fold PLP-dependent enzyme [Pirellulales bacterium]
MAIHGGLAALPEGPPAWPLHDPDVLAALQQAYADGSWGRYHGPHSERLRQALAQMHDVEHVSLCCSGTFAVELALRGLKVGSGDEVILAGYDFSGNFRAIEAVGALPVLVDVDPQNWNLDPALLSKARSERTRAIVVSHLHGGLIPMREVMAVACEHGLAVVEDACQAHGAKVEGRLAGAWGDVGVLSFGGSKLLTSGRGGAILTRRADVLQRAKVFCEQGNHAFPLSELQAAVLLPQVAKLAARNAARAEAVERFWQGLAGVSGLRPLVNRVQGAAPAYYKLGFKYLSEEFEGRSRYDFIAAVQAEGVALDAGFRGFALRSERRRRAATDLTHSMRAATVGLVLHHPLLLQPGEIIDRAAQAICKVAHGFQEETAS